MALTKAATGLTVQQWDSDFFKEYIDEGPFSEFFGTSEDNIIQLRDDLTKKAGDSITYALLNRLVGVGVTGTDTLEGNEEDLATRSFRVYVDKVRHAVKIAQMEEQRSAISLRNAARTALKSWIAERTRDDIIKAMAEVAVTADNKSIPLMDATAAQRNTWNQNNADRVLYGATKANYNSVFATAAANVDNTNDRLTGRALSLMKRLAQMASPKVRPISAEDGKRVYIVFCNPLAFRDLAQNLETVNRDAWVRGLSNPIFSGADLYYDGLVIKQVDDIPVYPGIGTSGADVSPVYLCGAQAIAMAWARRTWTVAEEQDYGDKYGVSINEIRGIRKMQFGTSLTTDTGSPKDHGIVTGFFATPAD